VEASKIMERLNTAGVRFVRERNLSIPRPYWGSLDRLLIEPAVENLTATGATEEQVAGSEKKLEFLLDEVIAETREHLRTNGPFLGEEDSQVAAETVVSGLLQSLCPFWPFCE